MPVDRGAQGGLRRPWRGRSTASAPDRTCIMVNQRGRRFTNEAANYNAFGEAFHVDGRVELRVRQPPGMDGVRRRLPRAATAWPATPRPTADTIVDRRGAHAGGAGRHASASRRRRSRRPSSRWNDAGGRGPMTSTSGAATARTTAGGATRRSATMSAARSARSTRRRTTPSQVHSGALGHQGRAADRRRCSGARPRRRSDPRAVRRGQRHGLGDGHDLRRRRRDARSRHGVRLPRRPPRRALRPLTPRHEFSPSVLSRN